ncbi:hypothetical protein BDM02DRAFT_3194475 [Thelephora ganbajun]|uniref:Uncharacterized protein n=1 Tax=Thelephora ganbajun TaxID=370292 RepID=A0ACB6YX43_THEGA|nr:hypothetical protein BDM02DRAFT_3194475 [Thelephora ganbajun]
MVAGGPCTLEFSFSPEVEWSLSSHLRVLIVLHASPFHKRRFLRVASRKARLGYSYLLLTHRLLEHPIVILPFWTAEAFDVYLREMIALPMEGEEGELKEVVTRLGGGIGCLLGSCGGAGMGGEGGVVEPMDAGEAAELGLRPDFQDLVDRPDPIDTSAPLFPHLF